MLAELGAGVPDVEVWGLTLVTGLECTGRCRKYGVAGCGRRLAGLGYVKAYGVQHVGFRRRRLAISLLASITMTSPPLVLALLVSAFASIILCPTSPFCQHRLASRLRNVQRGFQHGRIKICREA
jgi:hypothetical protein